MVLINLNGTIQLLRWHLGEGGGGGRMGNPLKYERIQTRMRRGVISM